MQKSTGEGGSFDDPAGGADAVQKTTWVTGQGTDPAAADATNVSARVPSGSGVNLGAWVVGGIAVVIALVYGFGILR